MRALITGGAGFIGSNFIRMVLKNCPDWEILNFDLLTYAGNLQSLEDVSHNSLYRFIKGDIAERADLEKAFESHIDIIINFAAETHVDKSLYEASRFFRTNAYGVGVLLEAAMEHSVGRFIHISTDEVYGPIPESQFADEQSPLNPGSPYAASKAASDLLCQAFFKTHKFPIAITRSSNNYGAYQFPEKIIPFFITEALTGRQLPLYGHGENVRNWLHVEDNCRAILTLVDKGVPGEIYNIGGDNYLDNLALTRKLLTALHLPETSIKHVEDRPGHDLRYAIDCSKIKALGWKPEIAFDDGLAQTIRWYSEHEDWRHGVLSEEHHSFRERHYKNR